MSGLPVVSARDTDAALREQLSSLQGLLVVSMLMTESTDEHHITYLAATTVPSLGPARVCGVYLRDGGWQQTAGPCVRAELRADLEAQFVVVSDAGGPLAIQGDGWGWAFTLRSPAGQFGYLVVSADDEPEPDAQFLLRVLAQQTGIALASAQMHARDRANAEQLRASNDALESTVAADERSMAIHDRLTRVALEGDGPQGIAEAVHALTSYPIAVEDQYGNLMAWAGTDGAPRSLRASVNGRAELLERARIDGQVVRDGDRFVAVATAGVEVLGVLALIDPEGRSGAHERVALEHGATVLTMELARLASVAESELRLVGGLVEGLLSGELAEPEAHRRANALGYDLAQLHRVVVVGVVQRLGDGDSFCHAVRRAARDAGVGTLLADRSETVIVLSDADSDWDEFRMEVDRNAARLSRIGVGGLCSGVAEYPRSFHEAQLALGVQEAVGGRPGATVYDNLGVYQLLADVAHVDAVEQFAKHWLGALLAYDERRNSALVETLSLYLERGRSHNSTAKELAVHRSTLKYRLQRSSEISGYDLSDPDTSFNLQLAIRAWRTLAALRGSNT